MTKITADHLARGAFVYVRQSTADQLVHNQESLRRQSVLQKIASYFTIMEQRSVRVETNHDVRQCRYI